MRARVGVACLAWLLGAALPSRAHATTAEDDRFEDEGGAVEAGSNAKRSSSSGSVGAHVLLASGKVIPGVTLRGGSGWFFGAFEASFLFLNDVPPQRSAFLGNQLGGYFMLRPFARGRFELEAGLGVDAYPLWGIHGDEWQVALSTRAAAHARLYREFGAFVTARAYPVATSGLELGVHRNGSSGLPVMFGAGLEWWP